MAAKLVNDVKGVMKENNRTTIEELRSAWIAGPMSACAAGLSNQEGGSNVVDNCCDTDSSLGIRAGEQLHDGWVHPYFDCARYSSDLDQRHHGSETRVNDFQVVICHSYIE